MRPRVVGLDRRTSAYQVMGLWHAKNPAITPTCHSGNEKASPGKHGVSAKLLARYTYFKSCSAYSETYTSPKVGLCSD